MKTFRRIAWGAILPIAVLAGYAAWSEEAANPFFPTLSRIADRFQQLWLFARFESDVLPSLRNFVVGYVCAVIAGVAVGVLIGRVHRLRPFLQPLLDFGRSVPAIMLIPPLVLVLGIGDSSKIAIIALGAFFPVVLATIDGMRRVDPALIDVTRSLGLPQWKTTVSAWLPAASPSIAGGMQTGMQFALVLMVSSEMLAATRGVGYMTMQAQLTFDSASVWAGITLLAVLGFSLNALFVLVRSKALKWHIAMRAATHER